MARYGYGRVSTRGQAKDGNSLEEQERELRQAGCDEVVLEAYTGTKMARPKFEELSGRLRAGDTLVVCKLDRFARTARDGLEVVERLMEKGISVHILNMGLLEDTATGRVLLTVMLAFAEFERSMIVERTAAGKAYKRENDPEYREGRKPKGYDEDKYRELRVEVDNGNMSVSEAARSLGVSRAKWYRINLQLSA